MNVLENVCKSKLLALGISCYRHVFYFSDKMLNDFFPSQVSQILSELMWKIRLISIRLGYPNLDVLILPS